MLYRLDELARLATDMGLQSRRVDSDRLDILIADACILAFCNFPEEPDTLVGFDGTPWHSHGQVGFQTGEATYVEYDELEMLIALGTGDLLIVSEYSKGAVRDRWLAHRQEALDLQYLQPGAELRVFRLPDLNRSTG